MISDQIVTPLTWETTAAVYTIVAFVILLSAVLTPGE
jgi:hypothetical protein